MEKSKTKDETVKPSWMVRNKKTLMTTGISGVAFGLGLITGDLMGSKKK
jgi:hypothetical protein